jgi:hypothetical protein
MQNVIIKKKLHRTAHRVLLHCPCKAMRSADATQLHAAKSRKDLNVTVLFSGLLCY